MHVDAAYAGAALLCPEFRTAVGGTDVLARFHSFNTNMHKWLLTNFDASCAFVRDRRWLAAALGGADAHVYRNAFSDGGLVTDYRDWQIPLGRRFRSLKVWFVLRSYGAAGLRAYVRRSVGLGEAFAAGLRARPDLFEILTGPAFALTVFGMVGDASSSNDSDSETTRQSNDRTLRLYEAVNASGRLWVTSTRLVGGTRFAIRVMTGNRLTEDTHVQAAVRLMVETAEGIVKG